jgi:hypothetical protein
MSEFLWFLPLALAALLWLDNRRVQEIAAARCRQACEAAGLQFLDDVAPLWRLRLVRDARGVLRLQRLYAFEYFTPQGERRRGGITMLGNTPIALQLEGRSFLEAKSDRGDRVQ